MVTPLAGPQALDVAGLERLVEHVLGGGVHGLFVLGTTGEAAALDDNVRRELILRTCRLVAGRVPVLVGVTDTRVTESVSLANFAAECGASAAVVSTPFYLPLEQQELVAYVKGIVSNQPLPCYLYNIPALTKTAYEPATVVRLAELPGVIGMKDSSGDLNYLLRLRQSVQRKDWSFFVGTELQLAEAVRNGIHGCVGGGANLDPALLVGLYEAAVRGDDDARVAALQRRLALLDRIYRVAPGSSAIVRGLKCALRRLSICNDQMGEPLRACTPTEREAIEEVLEQLGLLPPGSPPGRTSGPSPTRAAAAAGAATAGAGLIATAQAG
jgi:4-hydroxy-tetrahydrodipicolinate synthase